MAGAASIASVRRATSLHSNKPELVVVESPVSEARMRDMFQAIDAVLRRHKEVGKDN